MHTEHLLIIRFSAVGDVAMTVPLVYSLAHQYPRLRITVLSRSYARCLFQNIAPNVGFMAVNVKKEFRGLKGLNRLYRRLVAKRFTAIADFHHVLRSDYLRTRFFVEHYKVAHINKHRSGRRQLVATNHKLLIQQPTAFQNYADVLEQLGYPVRIDFHSIFPPEGGDLQQLPGQFHKKEQCWIGIAPFAAHTAKVYPQERMEQVISQIAERHPDCRIFFFGFGDEEFNLFDHWSALYPICRNASRQLGDMQKELVLMSHLDVMISMDSANMHLASLVGVPVVSIWGATHPYAGFLGWGQNLENAVQLDLPCRPCSIFGNKACLRGDYACLRNITPDIVVERVENLLNMRR